MVDTRLVDLDPGNAEGTDIVYAVKNPSGVPLDRKIALSNIKDYILSGSPPTFTDAITVRSTDTGANAAPDVILYRDSASPADNDILGQIKFDGEDSAGNQQTYGTITGQILDEASTSEDGALLFGVVTAGTLANEVRLDGSAIAPVTSDGNALGTSSLMWSDLFLASGAVVNFNNGDVTLTHSADTLTMAGGNLSLGTTASLTTGTIELGAASDTTIIRSSAGDIAVEGNVVYRAGGTDVALADGGTGASLTDPNADRIMFWDDSAGTTTWLEPSKGLSIVGTTLIPGREVLAANRTYYVRTDGSDSNTGLTNTSGGAFATIQKAIDTAVALDLSIYSVTISVADGTYSSAVALKPYIGTGPITITGNVTTPANCVISPASGAAIASTTTLSSWAVNGFRLAPSTGHCVYASGYGVTSLNKIRFDCATNVAAIRADFGAQVLGLNGTFEMRNNCGFCFLSGFQAQINFDSSTITYGSNVAYSQANCFAQQMGVIIVQGVTYDLGGFTITGTRYNVLANSLINTNGAGATFIPGNVAGTTSGDGVYN